MTHFAPVGPLGVLRELPRETLGNYHLLIAPKILENPEGYEEFFKRQDFVIVDNGVIELGYPMSVQQLYRAATIVRADVIVLPDTIDDLKMTTKQAHQNVGAFRSVDPNRKFKLMGVIQGIDYAECHACARAFMALGVDWFGVPRGLTPNLGSRVSLVRELLDLYPKMPIHVLGFSENIRDDIMAAAVPGVVGMDAATPLWYGNLQHTLPQTPPTVAGYGRRPEGYWQSSGASYEANYNVGVVRRWLASVQPGAPIVPTSEERPVDPQDQLTPI